MARAAQEHFREGGSLTQVMLVMLTIGAIVVFTILLALMMARHARRRKEGEAWQVFDEGLQRLKLSAAQQRFLRELALHPRLDNPNVLLLSPSIFDRQLAQFAGRPADAAPGAASTEAVRRARLVMGTQLRDTLFQRGGGMSRGAW